MRPGAATAPSRRLWLVALLRPATLWAAAAPVAVGAALAHADGRADPGMAALALVGAIAIQIGTNLFNDYADFVRGTDARRVGPPRLLPMGWMTPRGVLGAVAVAFAVATAAGAFLVWHAGWPLVAVGVLSMLSGLAYTGGPYPLGYHGLGDLFVFVFFGIVAVCGTYYVQALTLAWSCLPAATAVGALATTILVANNLRDHRGDAEAGKRTLVVVLGPAAGRLQFFCLGAAAFAAPPLAWAAGLGGPGWMLSWLSAPLAWAAWRTVRGRAGAEVAPALAQAARLEAAFSGLLAVGIAISPPH